jgi:hypothetical protein
VCRYDFTRPIDAAFDDGELDALLETAARLSVAARGIDEDVRAACNGIATDLGGESSSDTARACANAKMQIDRIKSANATAVLTVEYEPAVCSVSASAYVDCVGRCDASFDARATPPRCMGGMLSGTCSGTCTGRCTVEGTASCSGSCQGRCEGACDAEVSGECTGTCMGQCEGTCMAMGADGSCAGTCDGICRGRCEGSVRGSCSGSCSGSCMGSCTAEVTASCSGRCTGSCDVMFTEPRCEGGEWSVDADVDCQAACRADASFALDCTEPRLVVTFTGTVDSREDLLELAASLERHMPRLLAAAARAETVVSATVDFATRLGAATSAAAAAGLEASACLVAAVEAQVAATASIRVSVMASVSVSGSVSGSSP